jgi:hypothetical protein
MAVAVEVQSADVLEGCSNLDNPVDDIAAQGTALARRRRRCDD